MAMSPPWIAVLAVWGDHAVEAVEDQAWTRALLAVNVLIALMETRVVHHEQPGKWLRDNVRHGWATCPITVAPGANDRSLCVV